MYRNILFDLDGTLIDSKEGILNCLRYALEKMGRPVPEETILMKFIGPPFQHSFPTYCGMSQAETEEAIRCYRERYIPTGQYESTPAPGMLELCRQLKAQGLTLAVASSKPEVMCNEICRWFGFAPYMDGIIGSTLQADWTKADVLRETFHRLQITEPDLRETVLVGDRKYDVEGARTCGIDCIGVEFFGYAEPGELAAAGAVAVFQRAEDLGRFLLEEQAEQEGDA